MDNTYILKHILNKLDECKIYSKPFPYLEIDNILPTDFYNIISNELNNFDILKNGGMNLVSGGSKYRNTTECKSTDKIERACLPENLNLLKNIFMENNEIIYDKICSILQPNRKTTKLERYLYFSYSKDEKGYFIGPHPDSDGNIYSCLLYLPLSNNNKHIGTELYSTKCKEFNVESDKCIKKYKLIDEINPDNKYFKVEKKIEYVKNKLIIFPPSNNTWHGVRKIDVSRNTIQFFWIKRY